MALTKLNLPPDQTGYSVTDGNEVSSAKLDGGASRFRRDVLGATSNVTVQWSVGPEMYRYLRAFYRILTNKGAVPFLINLLLDSPDLTEHKAYFVPGSMRLQSQKGLQYIVAAQLEVHPAEENEDDGIFAIMFSELGSDYENLFPVLESDIDQIINVDFPGYLQ